MTPVAALFVRADSIYKTLPGVDAWDEARDARQWPGVVKPQRGIPRDHRKIITKAEREHTPPAFAAWLVEVARRARQREARK
jgi:hypothetical protein